MHMVACKLLAQDSLSFFVVLWMSCRPTLCPSIGMQSLFWRSITSLRRLGRILPHGGARSGEAKDVSASACSTPTQRPCHTILHSYDLVSYVHNAR